MDGTGSERCDKCIKDTTVTRAQRIRRWPTSQKARKERHMVQFHAPYRQANRWIKMNVKEGECFSRLTPSLRISLTRSFQMCSSVLSSKARVQCGAQRHRVSNARTSRQAIPRAL